MKQVLTAILAVISFSAAAYAEGVCEGSNKESVCLKMRHMRASINALDAQRELMQVNPSFFAALGAALRQTAAKVRTEYGIGIPEHLMGISGVERLGEELAIEAVDNNIDMLKTANQIRNQCASCHASGNSAGGVDWDQIFNYDWNEITQHCNKGERNPYLCRSMNGMLSAYGYLMTAHDANMPNFSMTQQAADEITRILVDIQVKGFNHLPEDLRDAAEAEARMISKMAADKNPEVFERATQITNACQKCHALSSVSTSFKSLGLGKFSWKKSS
jgi:hypothetical protein